MKVKKNKFNKHQLLTLLLFIPAMLFTACNNDDDVAPIENQDISYVSLYQASPDAPDMRVVVDSRQINASPFEYANHTGYLRFYAGERTMSFGPFDGSNVVSDTTLNLMENEFYSIFVTDEYPEVQPLIINDTNEAPDEGMAKIRFLHLSPDAPAVNLEADEMEMPLAESAMFNEIADFMEVEAGNYDLTVNTSDGDETVLEIPNTVFQEGGFYTVIVRGYANPPAGNNNDLTAEILIN